MHLEEPVSVMPHEKLIQFQHCFNRPFLRFVGALTMPAVEKALAVDRINDIYAQLLMSCATENPFGTILSLLDIEYTVSSDDQARIPDQGPLVVIANHPFGAIEGIILADLLLRIRADTKVMGNYLLQRIAPIRNTIIPVDPFGRRALVGANARSYRSCLRWLKEGNSLVAFPAGEVSHFHLRQGGITDPPWSAHVAGLVRMSGAQVLPIFFPGRNSLLFNLAGLFHPRLRTLMLARELVAQESSRIPLCIGRCIPFERMRMFDNEIDLTLWLRFNTYFVANRMAPKDRQERFFWKRPAPNKTLQELIAPVNGALLAAEFTALPERSNLVTHKQMAVFIADSEEIPNMLREIGRLREKTFREVGEGTGKAMDVDLFDSYYRHLVLFNTDTAEVVGAYRIGDTGDILARFGRRGLYTQSLFRFKSCFLTRYLSHSLELGRAFIRSEYQRQPNCLALLWRGIGAYLVKCPGHRMLFGPVSISNSYHRVSKQIIVQFLRQNCTSPELSAYVSPRCPFRIVPENRSQEVNDRLSNGSIDDVSLLISEIERDGKRVPVLIKHYLKLNGQFIAFNIDREFCDAIDGLVVVELMKTETKLLDRFMGEEGRRAYMGYWLERESPNGLRHLRKRPVDCS